MYALALEQMDLVRQRGRLAVLDQRHGLDEPGVKLDREDSVLDGRGGGTHRRGLGLQRDDGRREPHAEAVVVLSDLLEEIRQRLLLRKHERLLVFTEVLLPLLVLWAERERTCLRTLCSFRENAHAT